MSGMLERLDHVRDMMVILENLPKAHMYSTEDAELIRSVREEMSSIVHDLYEGKYGWSNR